MTIKDQKQGAGFTPGPWEVHEPLECKGRCGYPHNRAVVVHRDYEILVADCGTRSKVAKDNARLIATAPDLYEAARFARSVLAANPMELSERMAIEKLDAALALVEKKQQ